MKEAFERKGKMFINVNVTKQDRRKYFTAFEEGKYNGCYVTNHNKYKVKTYEH
jgi:hypothetical protein